MPTPLYTTDVQKIVDRTPKTALLDTDVFVVADEDGTLAPITKPNVKNTLGISENESDIIALDTNKADKDTGAIEGNFASFDAFGNPVDSGKKDADYEDADVTILKQSNIINALDSTSTTAPLSANQGKVLKDAQDLIKGTGWTDENLVDHEVRIGDLETNDTLQDATLGTLKETVLSTKLAVNELERQAQIGNGATLDFSDIGTVVLDARATGRANPTVEGLTATNLVENGDGSSTNGWIHLSTYSTESVVDGWIRSTKNANRPYFGQNIPAKSGDVVVILSKIRGSKSGSIKLQYNTTIAGSGGVDDFGSINITTEPQYIIKIKTLTSDRNYIIIDGLSFTTNGDYVEVGDVIFINLTQTFGAGNEPDLETCQKLFSNYFSGTKSIQLPAMVRSVGKNLFDKRNPAHILEGLYIDNSLRIITNVDMTSVVVECLPSTTYILSKTAGVFFRFGWTSEYPYHYLPMPSGTFVSSDNATSLTITTGANAKYLVASVYRITDTISKTDMLASVQLELGSTATPYAPYTDSTLYIADNEEVRSIQDVQDTLTMVNGEYIYTKKVSTPASVASGVAVNVTNYPTAKTGGKFAVELTAGGTQIGVIGTDSTSGAGMLRFELATPIITPLLTSGTLKAFQNGSVYYEPYYEGSHQTNASSQITLPYEGTIEAVYGYDEDLVEYLLDSSEYSLTGTTLTITGALENEVWFVKMSRAEPLSPEMSVNVLNNMVVPTTVATATYTVLEGDHTLLVSYTTTGAVTITIPTALIQAYKRLTIKDSGGNANVNNITIGTQGTEKIDGADTYVINTAKGKVELASDGANMFVVG